MNLSLMQIKEKMMNQVISALVDMRYMTKADREAYQKDLLSKLQAKTLVTTIREQHGLTNAEDYNQTAYELYLDMLTTFTYLNELYDSINSHQLLNESIINTLYSQIAALNDRLDECEAVIGIAGSPDCFKEGFRTQNFMESDRKYYTERYGERMPLATYAMFNSEQENITLNYTRQQNVMVYKSGVQLGEIMLTKQYGAGFIKARNAECKLENAIDTSMSSYWAETVLADAEMKVVGEGFEDQNGLGLLNRSYYNLPRGAMCEICFVFEALAKVNEIVLRPFGNFPIDIVAIRYTLGDEPDDDVYDVVCPDNPEREWLESRSIKQEYAFHFPEIICKRLYILINQIHCIKSTYMVSADQMFKNELWFNATYDDGSDVKMPNTTVFSPLYLDKAGEDPTWVYINNKMLTNKQIDINKMLLEAPQKLFPVTKYQYTYGFYNIVPNYVEFQKAGIWVSQEIEVDGPIDTITLESDEEHFKTMDGYIATDIEFYITTKKNPEYTDWKPICPKNKDYVYRELLQLDYDYCYLRHPAVCGSIETDHPINKLHDSNGNLILDQFGNTIPEKVITHERPIVYMNDIVLIEDSDYILRFDDDGNAIAVEIANIDHFAMYTVSYKPTDSSKEVSLIDANGAPIPSNTFEEIQGNNSACYQLSAYPYYSKVYPEKTSSYVKITNITTGETWNQTTRENSPVVCVTNKLHPEDSYKGFINAGLIDTTQGEKPSGFKKTNRIQYYTNGRHVYFNRPILPTEKIEINYPSFDCKIRLKIILRRNTKRDSWITPVLHGYKLMFTTV